MTLYEFNILEQHEQREIVLNGLGVYLDNFISGVKRYNLYAIDKFFVEVEYNTTKNKIVGLTSFKTGNKLDRYSNLKGII